MYSKAYEQNVLPTSLHEALIVLIPKLSKDPRPCESYRPIALINVDIKILAKVLVRRLNNVIDKLIHPDQTGFILGRSTAINLRHLFTNLQISMDHPDTRIVVSLDTQKVFDSIEWPYLFAILEWLGFGTWFTKWVKLLYTYPTA